MSRDSIQAKALRRLGERRLRVIPVDGHRIEARVRGTDAEHVTGHQRSGWSCDYQAHQHGRRSSHLAALQLVGVLPSRAESSRHHQGRTGTHGGTQDRAVRPLPVSALTCTNTDLGTHGTQRTHDAPPFQGKERDAWPMLRSAAATAG